MSALILEANKPQKAVSERDHTQHIPQRDRQPSPYLWHCVPWSHYFLKSQKFMMKLTFIPDLERLFASILLNISKRLIKISIFKHILQFYINTIL